MEVYVARQPIYNEHNEIFAYELLYRNNQTNAFPNIDGDVATSDVIITSFLNIGIDELSAGMPCFVNFTESLLKLDVPSYFSPRDLVVEILETMTINEETVALVRGLKEKGYRIALDDFSMNPANPFMRDLIKLADFVKVDFRTTTKKEREQTEILCKFYKITLLAEKIETEAEYLEAKSKGYSLYQGYFFSKPTIMSSHDIPPYIYSYFNLIEKLSDPEPNIELISDLIKQDLSLSYKLLKLVNSPAFRPSNKINSIQQAVVLLGIIEIQKWIFVLAVRDHQLERSAQEIEVVTQCLIRAHMCELIAKAKYTFSSSSFFLTGMFSLMDTILSLSLDEILKKVPLHEEIRLALLGVENTQYKALKLVKQLEQGNWEDVDQASADLGIQSEQIGRLYKESILWAEDVIHATKKQEASE
ncbi:hypothetical protein Q73_00895 [Bacillus coahuilensis m2-6]|uniref:Histidine kinase n=1 Tax=Bacillus coahuilensis p1.1.43 TaxID=1150625 RepID=A0A147KC27_9BACI|nr:HDOD domain-containing protein [Bacillus coahuilensis]KUP09120.1 hypothetical protein Q75_01395 [Bacillus coahuilensis p1.1.43]KUP09829.1 hypothetical protein Q73_00895 [Bacillus coahuilensis m2-6]